MFKRKGKRLISLFVVMVFILTMFSFEMSVSAEEGSQGSGKKSDEEMLEYSFADDRVLVVMKDGSSLTQMSLKSDSMFSSFELVTKAKRPKGSQIQGYEKPWKDVYVAKLKNKGKQNVLDAIKALEKDPNVEYAEPDYIIKLNSTIPNDPWFYSQYGMERISAPDAWDINTGDPSVVVGVLDTGIDYYHSDLINNIWINPGEIPGNGVDDDNNGYVDDYFGYDFADGDSDPSDFHGHGTHVAGIIAAEGNNNIGVAGVTWNCKVAAIKIFPDYGDGTFVSKVAEALAYASMMNIKITNNSWGGSIYSQVLYDAIAAYKGLFVAAAGNDSWDNDIYEVYPACYDLDNIISVAATNSADYLAGFSNYGDESVDIAAPGDEIISCIPGNWYFELSGTSMAAPHVTGAAALIKSVCPDMLTDEIKDAILSGADYLPQLDGLVAGGRRLNVYKSLQMCQLGVPQNILIEPKWQDERIDISWDPVATATGYDVEVNGAIAASVSTTYFSINEWRPNVRYNVRVRAKRDNYVGEWSNVQSYTSPPIGSSIMKASMPTARMKFGAVAYGGKIYAIGGEIAYFWVTEEITDVVEEYDIATDTWTTKASMPTARAGLKAVELNGKIYAIGGYDENGNVVGTVEEYDPVTDTWTTKADITPREKFDAFVANGKIYVIGSVSSSNWEIEVYDQENDMWIYYGYIWNQSYDDLEKIISIDNRIFGLKRYKLDENEASIVEYIISEGSVQEIYHRAVDFIDVPLFQYELTGIYRKGQPQMYIVGGLNKVGGYYGKFPLNNIVMNGIEDSSSSISYFDQARVHHAVVHVNGSLYILGGYYFSYVVSDVEEYIL
ncbi:MAG: S8 family serine peptidase [Clostridiaceae bacterium]|nr:S8 family serine peptidase [Clostridiaceae bacterium]